MELYKQLHTPPEWRNQTDEAEEYFLSPDHDEYLHILSLLYGIPLKSLKISRIQNPFLHQRYLIKMLEYQAKGINCTELELFHTTDKDKVHSIIRDNLDWRKVKRTKFGKGVTFSPFTSFVYRECCRSDRQKAIIICKVLIGNSKSGCYYVNVPPDNYDTTTGNCGGVIVKYYDDEFYPTHVVYL